VQPTTLPEAGSGSSLASSGLEATISGWGMLAKRGTLPNILQKVTVDFVDINGEKRKERFHKQLNRKF